MTRSSPFGNDFAHAPWKRVPGRQNMVPERAKRVPEAWKRVSKGWKRVPQSWKRVSRHLETCFWTLEVRTRNPGSAKRYTGNVFFLPWKWCSRTMETCSATSSHGSAPWKSCTASPVQHIASQGVSATSREQRTVPWSKRTTSPERRFALSSACISSSLQRSASIFPGPATPEQ